MRLKWTIVVVALCVVVTAVAVACAAGRTSAPEVLRAQHFELVDVAGRVRAELGFWPDGSPGLVLYDERGDVAAAFPASSEAPRPTVPSAARGTLYEGVGDDIVTVSSHRGGVATLHVRGNAAGEHFAVTGYDGRGEYTGLLVNTTDAYAGRVRIPEGTTRLEVNATGPWSLTLE
jgi:hypothetical protein